MQVLVLGVPLGILQECKSRNTVSFFFFFFFGLWVKSFQNIQTAPITIWQSTWLRNLVNKNRWSLLVSGLLSPGTDRRYTWGVPPTELDSGVYRQMFPCRNSSTSIKEQESVTTGHHRVNIVELECRQMRKMLLSKFFFFVIHDFFLVYLFIHLFFSIII